MNNKECTNPDILIVPSAILVPDELRLDVGSIPTGMIPLRGKPMLEWIAGEYDDIGVQPVVAVHEKSDMIREYVSQSDYDWILIDVERTTSLGETIKITLNQLGTDRLEGRELFINFADTFVTPVPQLCCKDYICRTSIDRTYRWTTFNTLDDKIKQITPKYEQSEVDSQQTFVGQFHLTDPVAFQKALQTNQKHQTALPSIFYSALLDYFSDRDYSLITPELWLDVGHLDTYHQAKKEFLNARNFNELQVNQKNVLTKRSEDASKLIKEIKWYQQIPSSLQPYLPRIYDSSTDQDPYIEIEYIGYQSLSDIQLFGSHGVHIWNNIFYRLIDMIAEFSDYSLEADEESIHHALKSMYITKTRDRLEQLRENSQFSVFFDSTTVYVNNKCVPSIGTVLNNLEEIVESENLLKRDKLSIIHGDLCLPNILFDPRNQIIKLIDPRGEFGEFDIYGDPRYDLAKLRHSFVGHYEHLINNRFSASTVSSRGEITYEVKTTTAQRQRESRFDQVLVEQACAPLEEIKLIEALLYLSMVPLHSDSYERQLCMLGKGLTKIKPYVTK